MSLDWLALFGNPEHVFPIIVGILSFGLTVTSLEDLYSFQIFSSGGMLSWNVSKLQSRFFLSSKYSALFDCLFGDLGFKAILYLRLLASIATLFLAILGIIPFFLIFALFLFSLLISVRGPYGLDGAHQMTLIVLFALSIATLSGIPSKISAVCLWFLAGEIAISYSIAGTSKIISPVWRKTYALLAIFSTKTYGNNLVYRVVNNKLMAYLLCWSILIFETFFPVSFLNASLFVSFLSIGILFHLFNAIFMGLNTFFYSFLSTYPSLVYCAIKMGVL